VYSPNIFGLHSNAEIIYFTNYAKNLWVDTLTMQTSDGAAAGGLNRDEYITLVCEEIEGQLPEVFDTYNIRKKYEVPVPA
jgi:dynein heavy chain